MRMIEGRQSANAHKFLSPNENAGDAWLVVIVGRGMLGHSLCTRFEWAAEKGGAISIGTPILQRARLG